MFHRFAPWCIVLAAASCTQDRFYKSFCFLTIPLSGSEEWEVNGKSIKVEKTYLYIAEFDNFCEVSVIVDRVPDEGDEAEALQIAKCAYSKQIHARAKALGIADDGKPLVLKEKIAVLLKQRKQPGMTTTERRFYFAHKRLR